MKNIGWTWLIGLVLNLSGRNISGMSGNRCRVLTNGGNSLDRRALGALQVNRSHQRLNAFIFILFVRLTPTKIFNFSAKPMQQKPRSTPPVHNNTPTNTHKVEDGEDLKICCVEICCLEGYN